MIEAEAVLLLDFDGVVARNAKQPTPPGERLVRERVQRLNAILRRAPASVVASSTWRESANAATLTDWLRAAGFDGTVEDCTPVFENTTGFADAGVRGREIMAWLDAQVVRPKRMAILDDMFMDGLLAPHMVCTNERTGLTDEDVERAVALLLPMRPASDLSPFDLERELCTRLGCARVTFRSRMGTRGMDETTIERRRSELERMRETPIAMPVLTDREVSALRAIARGDTPVLSAASWGALEVFQFTSFGGGITTDGLAWLDANPGLVG